MIRNLNDRFKICVLQKKLERIRREHRVYKQSSEYMRLKGDEQQHKDYDLECQEREIYEEIEIKLTNELLRDCNKLRVPIPYYWQEESKGYWQEDLLHLEKYLTKEGYDKLREKVRQERMAQRQEKYLWWVPIVALFISCGALVLAIVSFTLHVTEK